MNFNIYISCPIATSQQILNDCIVAAGSLGQNVSVRYWVRGTTYNLDDVVNTCDAFVLMLPNNQFQCRIDSLPPGCKKELQQAVAHYRPLFIAYRDSSSEINFYGASIRNGMVSGITGSSIRLKEKIAPFAKVYQYKPLTEDQLEWKVIVPPATEERLLLLLL